MKAGKLRNRAIVERLAPTIDPYGQDSETWVSVGTYWCELLTTAATERLLGETAVAEQVQAIQFRGRIDVRPDDRLRINGKTIYLTSVMNPDNRGIALVCVGKNRQTP